MKNVRKAGIISINVLLWAFFIVTSTVFFLIAAVLRVITGPFDRNLKILHQFSCFWAALYVWVNPFWFLNVQGKQNVERNKPYILVANHQSWVDILVVFATFLHFKWVSKKAMFRVPLLGWNMWLNGYVPIDRGNEASREKCIQASRNWLRKGSSMLFFPEGTRSRDGKKMLPFKIGAFKLAVESGCDVLPLVIKGSAEALPKDTVLLHRKARMRVEILPPISVESFRGNPSGIESLMNHTRIQMTRSLERN